LRKGGSKNISNIFRGIDEPINVIGNAVSYYMGKEHKYVELDYIYNDFGDLVDIRVIPREGYEVLFSYYVKLGEIGEIIEYMEKNARKIVDEYKKYNDECVKELPDLLKKLGEMSNGNNIKSPLRYYSSNSSNNSALSASKTPVRSRLGNSNSSNSNNSVRRELFK